MATPRLLIVLSGATALVVGAIAALALNSWWVLVVLMGLHALASIAVVTFGLRLAADDADKPDPVTSARLEEEGKNPRGEEPAP
jgi:membrane protein implicated in regulation of membrane protease activity